MAIRQITWCALLTLAFMLGHSQGEKICWSESKVGDVVIVSDESNSLTNKAYGKEKDFIKKFVQEFQFGPFRFGWVRFSTKVIVGAYLDSCSTQEELIKKFDEASQIGTNTNTHLAADVACNDVFNKDRGDRPNAPNILMLITDGKPSYPKKTADALKSCQDKGVKIACVCVGDCQKKDMEPMCDSVHSVSSYDFEALHNETVQTVCKDAEVPTPPPPPPAQKVCPNRIQLELCFALDSSASIGEAHFYKVKEFVKKVGELLPLGDDACIATVTAYGTGNHPSSDPAVGCKDQATLQEEVDKVKFHHSTSHCERGLNFCRSYFKEHGRNNTKRLIVLISDGKSTLPADTKVAADNCKADGIRIVTVAAGDAAKRNDDELAYISSNPADKLTVDGGYPKLFDFAAILAARICAEPCETMHPVDLCLIVDGSGSVSVEQFEHLKQVTLSYTKHMTLGYHDYRITSCSFGTHSFPGSDPAAFQDNQDAATKEIMGLKYRGSTSHVEHCLDYCQTMFDKQGRPWAKKVATIASDGGFTDLPAAFDAADRCKANGVKIVTISFSKKPKNENLLKLASSNEDTFNMQGAENIYEHIESLLKTICKAQLCDQLNPTDICIMIDGSLSVGEKNFYNTVAFAGDITKSFDLGDKKFAVAYVVYATFIHPSGQLPVFCTDQDNAARQRSVLKFSGATSHCERGLNYCEKIFKENGRPEAKKVVLAFTDGKSSEQNLTYASAERLKANKVRIIAVSFGKSRNYIELKTMASSEKDVFRIAEGFQNVTNYIKEITKRTSCPDPCEDKLPVSVCVAADASGSVGRINFENIRNWLLSFTKQFTLGPNAYQFTYCAIGTHNHSSNEPNPGVFCDDQTKAETEMKKLSYRGSTSEIQTCYKYCQWMFSQRPGARNYALIITDGNATDKPAILDASKQGKKEGVTNVVVMTGHKKDYDTMNQVATKESYVYNMTYEQLPKVVAAVSATICKDANDKPQQ